VGKRVNIGIYIGPQDTDIAAWFNLLQENKQSRAKWARGLLCAYALHQKLPIGTINPNAPLVMETAAPASNTALLFGTGNSQAETKRRDRYGYGWQIRGPHREFITGSVINISISKAEVLPILDETWRNGHARATFLKSLIRDNLEYGEQAIAPKLEDLQKVYAAYMVRENSRKVRRDVDIQQPGKGRQDSGTVQEGQYRGGKTRRDDKPQQNHGPEPRDNPYKRQEPHRQPGQGAGERPETRRQQESERTGQPSQKAFDFTDIEPDKPKPPVQGLEKNPLLSQI